MTWVSSPKIYGFPDLILALRQLLLVLLALSLSVFKEQSG
jgi:hypothetical protein